MRQVFTNLYNHRFEIFLLSQVLILFGSLIFPGEFYEEVILPIFFLFNLITGMLLISKKKKLLWILIFQFVILAFLSGGNMIQRGNESEGLGQFRLIIYFIFYIVVTWNIIRQVWNEKTVDKKVILGLMSGYISLGFLAFFLFMSIEIWTPGSFQGVLLNEELDIRMQTDSIMYYAYITLLTIGYGEIIPVTPVAQKAAVLVGLIGQFYIVIITAVVVEKYIRHLSQQKLNQ
ncbi:ion channel [Tenacibaculum amylolyticum]|uniref:ion channel n=1 Tax=Tenacibaculum amylolyticum TaxID=104269 RepID=UPI00389661F8